MRTPEEVSEQCVEVRSEALTSFNSDVILSGLYVYGERISLSTDQERVAEGCAKAKQKVIEFVKEIRQEMLEYALGEPPVTEEGIDTIEWLLGGSLDKPSSTNFRSLISYYEARIALLSHEAGLYEIARAAYKEGYDKGHATAKKTSGFAKSMQSILDIVGDCDKVLKGK